MCTFGTSSAAEKVVKCFNIWRKNWKRCTVFYANKRLVRKTFVCFWQKWTKKFSLMVLNHHWRVEELSWWVVGTLVVGETTFCCLVVLSWLISLVPCAVSGHDPEIIMREKTKGEEVIQLSCLWEQSMSACRVRVFRHHNQTQTTQSWWNIFCKGG